MKIPIRQSVAFFLVICVAGFFSQCAKQEVKDKIKLDRAVIRQTRGSSGLTTTLQVQPEKLRSIAIFDFENVIGDEELNWMRRGLTQMLITDLSQSRYIDIVTELDLSSITKEMGIDKDGPLDASQAVSIARKAQVETALVGSFIRIGNMIRIDCHLYDTQSGRLLKADRVEDEGLETVFTMVDQLTRQVRDGLKLTLKDVAEFDKGLADATTNSVEAYRYFAEGLESDARMYYQEAANHFERAIAVDSTFATAYFHLARSYVNLARAEDARRTIEKAVVFSDHVTERERLNIMALNASLKGDVLEQIEIYEKMTQRFPNDKDTRFRLGRMYDRLGRFEDAIAQFEAALTIDPAYKMVYNQLGYSYSYQGRHEEAVENLKQYVELAPDEPNPHDSMGEIYKNAGLFDAAVDEFQEAIRLGPELHFPWLHLGLTYQEKGEFDEAFECFQKYIELAPSEALQANGHQLLAETYWAKGQYDAAVEAYREALGLFPQSLSSVDFIGELYRDQGDTVRAEAFRQEWFRDAGARVLEGQSFSDIAHFASMCIYLDINVDQLKPFIKAAWKLAENDRNKASCTGLRAMVDLKQGNVDSTLARWGTMLDLPWIQNRLGVNHYDAQVISQALAQSADRPEIVEGLYDKIVDISREMGNISLEASMELLMLEYYMKIDDEANMERALQATGAPREADWWIIGPFENKDGFFRRFPPERETKLAKTYTGKTDKVQWREAHDGLFDGYIDLKEQCNPDEWTVAYGLLSFDCPIAREAQFRVGTDDQVRIWLNGVEVWTKNVRRGAMSDNDIVSVDLKTGTNTVLIKICQTISEWGFFFRITDPEGQPFGDIIYLPQIIS